MSDFTVYTGKAHFCTHPFVLHKWSFLLPVVLTRYAAYLKHASGGMSNFHLLMSIAPYEAA